MKTTSVFKICFDLRIEVAYITVRQGIQCLPGLCALIRYMSDEDDQDLLPFAEAV